MDYTTPPAIYEEYRQNKVQITSHRSHRKTAPRIAKVNSKMGERYLTACGLGRSQES